MTYLVNVQQPMTATIAPQQQWWPCAV